MLVPRGVLSGLARCADLESCRYALSGVRLERPTECGRPKAIVTDGRRLVLADWEEPNTTTSTLPYELPDKTGLSGDHVRDFATIVPVAACKAADALGGKPRKRDPEAASWLVVDEQSANGTVPLGAVGSQGPATTSPEALEGRFPNWRDVLPEPNEQTVTTQVPLRQLVDVLESLLGAVPQDGQTDPDSPPLIRITLRTDTRTEHTRRGEQTVPCANSSAVVLTRVTEAARAVGLIMPVTGKDDAEALRPHWTGREA